MRGDGNVRDQWAYPVQSCCHISQVSSLEGGLKPSEQHIGTIFLNFYITTLL